MIGRSVLRSLVAGCVCAFAVSASATNCARLVGRTFASANVVATNQPGPWNPEPLLYVGDFDVFWVLDATDEAETSVRGHLVLSGPIQGIAASGYYAYVAAGSAGLRVIDVSDPSAPVEVGFYDSVPALGVDVSGYSAIVNTGDEGLRIIDMHDPASPIEVGSFQPSDGRLSDIRVSGSYVYFLDNSEDQISVLDVSRPWAPVVVGSYQGAGDITTFAVSGDYAYVGISAGSESEIKIIDMSDPQSPLEVGSCQVVGPWGPLWRPRPIFIHDNTLVAWAPGIFYGDFYYFDVTDPAEPVELGTHFGGYQISSEQIAASGSSFYVIQDRYHLVSYRNGPIDVIDVSDALGPVRRGSLGTPVDGVVQCGSLAILESGAVIDAIDPTHPVVRPSIWPSGVQIISGPYAYAASNSSLRVFDVTDCFDPVEVESHYIGTGIDEMAVSGAHVYLLNDEDRILVIDVSDPSTPWEVGLWDADTDVFDIAVSGSHAYVVAAGGDSHHGVLIVLDVRNPAVPVEVGGRISFTYGREPRVEASGSHVYVVRGYPPLVFDATNPLDLGEPVELPSALGAASNMVVTGTCGLLVSNPGLRVADLKDPASAFEVGRYSALPWFAVDVAVYGPYAYLSLGRHGLRIVDVSSCWAINPGHPGVPEFPDLPTQEE